MDSLYKNQKSQSIILERNPNEEINLNYTKTYDLSKLDLIEKITQEEKLRLLITIKKLLLSTNDYLDTSNFLDLLRYIILTLIIFILYLVIFSPIYKIYFMTEEKANSLPELSLYQKIKYYYLIEIFELIFRIVFNKIKRKKVKKIMLYYGRKELKKQMNNFLLDIDYNYNLSIRRVLNNNIYNELLKNFMKEEENSFFQYVINYPNVRYYNWDKKILNEKESEIAELIVKTIKGLENAIVKKYYFTVVLVWIMYTFSFKYLTLVRVNIFLLIRFGIFAFTKIMSIYMSNDLKKKFIEQEEGLNKNFLRNNYFVLISGTVINIFKVKESFIDQSANVEETYKNIRNDAINLNEKILNENEK